MKIVTDDGLEIPIESLKVIEARPGDVVVVTLGFPEAASDAFKQKARAEASTFLRGLFTGVRVGIIDDEDKLSLEVIRITNP